jgi:hypothetical protein
LRYWNKCEACKPFQYLHSLVENICQRYHKIPWGPCFIARSNKLQEKSLEVQFNSQDVFGYLPSPKESWSTYIKSSKLSKQITINYCQFLPFSTVVLHKWMFSYKTVSTLFRVWNGLKVLHLLSWLLSCIKEFRLPSKRSKHLPSEVKQQQ